MAHESDDWRPDVNVPRDYPPPTRPTAYANTPHGHLQAMLDAVDYDPRDSIERSALKRCLADVEAAAQRLRALLARLG